MSGPVADKWMQVSDPQPVLNTLVNTGAYSPWFVGNVLHSIRFYKSISNNKGRALRDSVRQNKTWCLASILNYITGNPNVST